DRPSKLFDGMHHARLAIILAKQADIGVSTAVLAVTRYNKWFKKERETLFQRLVFVPTNQDKLQNIFPKISTETEIDIVKKLFRCKDSLGTWLSTARPPYKLFYKITGVGHWFTITP